MSNSMFVDKPSVRRHLVISASLFVIALTTNVLLALVTRHGVSPSALGGDEEEYWNIASHLLHQDGLSSFPARRTLPYPMLIAGLRAILGDNYLQVQLALSALLAALPVLAYWVVLRHLRTERTALITGIACLLWPPFVRYSATLYSDSFGLLMFLVVLLSLPKEGGSVQRDRWHWLQWVLAGGLLGIAMQVKPLYLLYLPFAVLLCILGEVTLRFRFLAVTLLILGCAAAVSPWASYISHREGRLIFISANDGETLAGGFNPRLMEMSREPQAVVSTPSGLVWTGPGKWLLPEETGYLTEQELRLPYTQKGMLLAKKTKAWIISHPKDVAYLSARKLLYMWGIYPFWNGPSQSILGNIPLLILICLAGYGLWERRSHWARYAIFWTLPIFCSLVALVSWGSWRFRMPGDFGLLVLASALCSGRLSHGEALLGFLPWTRKSGTTREGAVTGTSATPQ
jgi:4-amino-4-deoxy-L-arabinose transferase-like glycosyltransferase